MTISERIRKVAEREPFVRFIETHELVRGKVNGYGDQVWPQAYESELKNTIPVTELSNHDRLKKLALLAADCVEVINHAIELGHLGEGSTHAWATDTLTKAETILKDVE